MPVGCSRTCPSESTKRSSLLAAMAIPLRHRRRSAHTPCETFDSRDAAARVTATQGRPTMNVRKALDAGAPVDEIRQVSLLAITTSGFPTAIAGLGWTEEVLAAP